MHICVHVFMLMYSVWLYIYTHIHICILYIYIFIDLFTYMDIHMLDSLYGEGINWVRVSSGKTKNQE